MGFVSTAARAAESPYKFEHGFPDDGTVWKACDALTRRAGPSRLASSSMRKIVAHILKIT